MFPFASRVYHIDDAAVAALTEYYGKHFKDGEDVLDICSSWVSHFPKNWKGLCCSCIFYDITLRAGTDCSVVCCLQEEKL